MSQEEINKMLGGFEKMTRQWQDAVVDTWGAMTKQVVASEEFSKASAEQMDWTMAGQKKLRDNSAQFLDSLEMPKRSDLARLSKQISNAESRLADCEGVLDKILAMVKKLDSRLESIGQASSAPASVSAEASWSAAKAAAAEKPAAKVSKPAVKADKPGPAAKKADRAAAAKNAGRAARKPR